MADIPHKRAVGGDSLFIRDILYGDCTGIARVGFGQAGRARLS